MIGYSDRVPSTVLFCLQAPVRFGPVPGPPGQPGKPGPVGKPGKPYAHIPHTQWPLPTRTHTHTLTHMYTHARPGHTHPDTERVVLHKMEYSAKKMSFRAAAESLFTNNHFPGRLAPWGPVQLPRVVYGYSGAI